MQNKILILIAALTLAGCATDTPPGIKVITQRVEVPIAVPCKAEVPKVPEFNFDKLAPEQDVFDKTKAILADRSLHLGYETELLAALTSCIK